MKIGKWKITIKDFVWAIICLILAICFIVGFVVCQGEKTVEVLSAASTAISIVLSIVAILYTMIEGANTSSVNQETIGKLNQIDDKVKELANKTDGLRKIIGEVDEVYKKIKKSDKANEILDEETEERILNLRKYLEEDIDD